MMNFGSAVEALKSGEAVCHRGVIYRYAAERNCLFANRGGVSTSVGSLPLEAIMADDWTIIGYEQKGTAYGWWQENADGTTTYVGPIEGSIRDLVTRVDPTPTDGHIDWPANGNPAEHELGSASSGSSGDRSVEEGHRPAR